MKIKTILTYRKVLVVYVKQVKHALKEYWADNKKSNKESDFLEELDTRLQYAIEKCDVIVKKFKKENKEEWKTTWAPIWKKEHSDKLEPPKKAKKD